MTRRGRKNEDWEDDGRTVVNMNVESMPGYRRESGGSMAARARQKDQPQEQLSPRETRMVMLASMKWALVFALGLVAILVLFILFCVKVWLA
jgi:hypothetical protein